MCWFRCSRVGVVVVCVMVSVTLLLSSVMFLGVSGVCACLLRCRVYVVTLFMSVQFIESVVVSCSFVSFPVSSLFLL